MKNDAIETKMPMQLRNISSEKSTALFQGVIVSFLALGATPVVTVRAEMVNTISSGAQ